MKEFIKKYKIQIIIIILVLFSLNRCTVACNRGLDIDLNNTNIESLKSTLNKQALIIDSLNRDIEEYQNRLRLYEDFRQDKVKSDSINTAVQKEQIKALKDIKNKINKKR